MVGKTLHRTMPWLAALAVASAMQAGAAAGELRRERADSPALGRSLAYALYLPDGYATGERRYPLLLLLHGLGGSDADWPGAGDIAATLDRLIAEGAVPPLIVVMPDGGDGWYVDSADIGGPGNFESAIADDLLAHVDAAYRTTGDRAGRLVAGLSMGGYGALRLAFFHPDRFAAAASLSGAVFPDLAASTEVSEGQVGMFRGAFGTPFDVARFNRENPFGRIPALAAMDRPPALFLTVGDDDGFGLYRGSLLLFLALKDAGVPVELRVTDGDHAWSLWRREIETALRFFAGVLRAP